jgi:peptidoglycan/LPS O-acetylase OafA/YrhL
MIINRSQSPHIKYRPDIDGLRSIAILSVVGFHAFPEFIHGGFIGVDIFFVISGYLISTIIFECLEKGNFSFIDFYLKRIRRIFPALLVVLVFCFLFGWFVLLAIEFKQLGKHISAGSGFISNLVFWSESGYFDAASDKKPLLHLWSLGIEEQFYIFWPLLLWIFWRLNLNLLLCIATLIAISFVLNIVQVRVDPIAAFYSPFPRFWELLVGGLLSSLRFHPKNLIFDIWHKSCSEFREKFCTLINHHWFSNCQSIFGLTLILFGFYIIKKSDQFPGFFALFPTIGTVLIISAGANAWLNRIVLSNKVFVWFGLISFPLYLWHWPMLVFGRIAYGEVPDLYMRVALVLASIFLAWLTYTYVEKPISLIKKNQRCTILIFLLMAIVGCIGLITYQCNGLEFRSIATRFSEYEKSMKTSDNKRCIDLPYAYKKDGDWFCRIGNQNVAPTIFAYGDSHAFSLLPALEKLAAEKNINILFASNSGCLPLLGVKVERGEDWLEMHNCPRLNDRIFNYIKDKKIKNVLLVAYWTYYNKSNVVSAKDTFLSSYAYDLLDSEWYGGVWYDFGIINTVKQYSQLGVNVFLFEDNPTQLLEPADVIRRTLLDHEKINSFSTSLAEHLYRQEYISKKFAKIKDPSLKIVNFDDLLCPKGICVLEKNGKILYSDIHHLSIEGAMLIYPRIKEINFEKDIP